MQEEPPPSPKAEWHIPQLMQSTIQSIWNKMPNEIQQRLKRVITTRSSPGPSAVRPSHRLCVSTSGSLSPSPPPCELPDSLSLCSASGLPALSCGDRYSEAGLIGDVSGFFPGVWRHTSSTSCLIQGLPWMDAFRSKSRSPWLTWHKENKRATDNAKVFLECISDMRSNPLTNWGNESANLKLFLLTQYFDSASTHSS